MLSEAVIKISPQEKDALKKYVRALAAFTRALQKEEDPLYVIDAYWAFKNNFTPKWGNRFIPDLKIELNYAKSGKMGTYYNVTKTIELNLNFLAKVKLSAGGFVFTGFNYEELFGTLVHEYVHYKQDMKVRDKKGTYQPYQEPANKTVYFQDPIEQHAWAVAYIQKLKERMPKMKSKDILNQLRSSGLFHNKALQDLKHSDYNSWKAIMKHAVMTAIHNSGK